MRGKLYGIGLGPGDPELVTLKAVEVLKRLDKVVCPQSRGDKKSIAFDIAKAYLKEDAEVINLSFPMVYDKEKLKEKWGENANIINEILLSGKNVGFLTIGDPTVYSTYMYLVPLIKELGNEVETIPGITSFCASAARINNPLAKGKETFAVIPLEGNVENIDGILNFCDNIVIMKPSSDSKILAQKLIEMGLEKNFALISKCGTKEEYISYDIKDLQLEKVPYMSIVIIKKEGLI